MLKKKRHIKVSVELYGGLYVKIQKTDVRYESGIVLDVTENSTPRDILKRFELPYSKTLIFFINNERASANTRFKDSDKLVCLTAASGG